MKQPRKKPVNYSEAGYLNIHEVIEVTGLSRAEVVKRISAGRFVTIVDGKRVKIIRQSVDDDLATELETRREAQRKGKAA